jgi:predicted amidohydrolase YtcJ
MKLRDRRVAGVMGSATVMAAVLSVGCAAERVDPADLVLRNGRIVTVDAERPEAQAVAVRGDTIVAVGSDAEIAPYAGEGTTVIDLQGRLATPGFIESHGHFTGVGDAKMQLNLMATESWEEIVAMVADAAKSAQAGQLIRGRGWHQSKWKTVPAPNVEGVPVHQSLSAVSPANPVILRHASGHAAVANARALELAGITRRTPNPSGGEIVKDARGNPTGYLKETAQSLLEPVLKAASDDEATIRRRIALASSEVVSKGVTTFADAGSSFETIDVFKKVVAEGGLPVRLWVMVRASNERLAADLPRYRTVNAADKHLTVRGIKKVVDGALGSRGAWLLEPYSDLPGSTGLNTQTVEEITETARLAVEHGYQMCVHAIGDRGNREVLDIFEKVFKANPDRKDLRWRVEHAQHLSASDIPRFGQLGVIASMQGIHCTSDAPYVPARLGYPRAEEGAYVWQKLMKSGAIIANGTDAPVEDVDPIASFYASVSRKLKDGSVFYPDERMTRAEALRSYTLNGAYAGFEENIKGSIAPGKLADIVVLSRDIMTVPEDEIPGTQVMVTIVGGKVVFDRAKTTD